MATYEGDLETAFSNGDPEAVLDFLIIRSHRKVRSEDDAVPVFSSDNDMATFVRDLTIDDAISHCFADLPSSTGQSVVSSAPIGMPSRPEKKLTESRTAAKPTPVRKHSDAKRHPVTARQPAPSKSDHAAANHNARGKSRGFLSTLLGRGHKGRRADGQRNAGRVKNDVSLQNSAISASFVSFGETNQSLQPHDPAAHTSLVDIPTVISNSRDSFKPVQSNRTGMRNPHNRDTVLSEAGIIQTRDDNEGLRSVHQDTNPQSAIVYGSSDIRLGIASSIDHRLEITEQESDPIKIPQTYTGECVSHVHESNIKNMSGVSSSHAHTNTTNSVIKTHVYPYSQAHSVSLASSMSSSLHDISNTTVTHAGNTVNKNNRDLHSAESLPTTVHISNGALSQSQIIPTSHTRQQTVHPAQSSESDEQKVISSRKPWEDWSDGIDAFIDFERDPNVEVPLDSHMSAKFGFEGRSTQKPLQRNEEHSTQLENKCLDTERTESSNVILQEEHSASGGHASTLTGKDPQTCFGTASMVTAASGRSSSNVPAPLLTSTSTQTEAHTSAVSERNPVLSASHYLRVAVSQLSALSGCYSCDSVISKTLTDLRKALTEIEGTSESCDLADAACDVTQPKHQTVSITQGEETPDEKVTTSELTLELTNGSLSRAKHKEPVTDLSTAPQTNAHINTLSSLGTSPQTSTNALSTLGNLDLISSTRSQTQSRHADKTTKPSKHYVSEKLATSSKMDSDSDSTSTVTSEPTTVLVCHRDSHRSSSKSSSVSLVSDQTVTKERPFKFNTTSEKSKKSIVSDTVSSLVTVSDLPPAVSAWKSGVKPKRSAVSVKSDPLSASSSRHHRPTRGTFRYAGEADKDYESFATSSWSEMTSVSSVSDIATSADESSYYSGDDDENDDEDDEEEVTTMVRLGLLDEDRDDSELRQHRLQRHLASVLRQNTIPTSTVETVVAATGERLNGLERPVQHVNQGTMYPFSSRASFPAGPSHDTSPSTSASSPDRSRRELVKKPTAGRKSAAAASSQREARSFGKAKKSGTTPRLFSPERQASLVSARQMTSEEFREGYDRSMDISKLKRSQLDGDVPWDLIPCSDTDDDGGSEKAWYNITSEEESVRRAYGSDTDSTVSDW